MKSEFLVAITQLAAERNLPRDAVLGAVEAALISAFKKDHLAERDLAVRIASATGDVHVFARLTVVADGAVADPHTQIALGEAQARKPGLGLGGVLEEEVTPANAGRIAAQTAKQVVMQRLREAEREIVFAEYAGKEGELLAGVVQRFEGRHALVDLGRAEALLPLSEQVPSERYRPAQRLKVLVLEVGKSAKGPQIVVSRSHKDMLRRLFELEVPEIHNGLVEIKAIAREAGFRSKVAVAARAERVDPVGSCVGLRGMRIQNIVNELHGEKIDVLEWSADPAVFIGRALGPAQVLQVLVRAAERTAIVVVPDRQLSLAIGREGQNARLAARLSGWRIDIKSASEAEAQRLVAPPAEVLERQAAALAPPAPSAPVAAPVPTPVVAGPAPQAAPAPAGGVEAPSLAEALARGETLPAAPKAAPRSAIRFAEEILGPRGRGPGRAKRGRGGREEGDEAAARTPKRGDPIEGLDYEPEAEQ